MLIQEFADKTGLTKDTIRFYEKIGILKIRPAQRRKNYYKEYSEENVALLKLVHKAKSFGFKLKDIKEWIQDWHSGNVDVEEKIKIFETQIQQIQEKIAGLQSLQQSLEEKLRMYKDKLLSE